MKKKAESGSKRESRNKLRQAAGAVGAWQAEFCLVLAYLLSAPNPLHSLPLASRQSVWEVIYLWHFVAAAVAATATDSHPIRLACSLSLFLSAFHSLPHSTVVRNLFFFFSVFASLCESRIFVLHTFLRTNPPTHILTHTHTYADAVSHIVRAYQKLIYPHTLPVMSHRCLCLCNEVKFNEFLSYDDNNNNVTSCR